MDENVNLIQSSKRLDCDNRKLNQLNQLDVKWFTEEGKLVRILDHCFTLRVFYFQKRIDITDFSYQIP